ncbi:hypothetical protein B0H11DRAFT_2200332 [Mycena galericulata]|nr:hypothetical protein B0H11DRAFT_2200332 [Mycena galericulata]
MTSPPIREPESRVVSPAKIKAQPARKIGLTLRAPSGTKNRNSPHPINGTTCVRLGANIHVRTATSPIFPGREEKATTQRTDASPSSLVGRSPARAWFAVASRDAAKHSAHRHKTPRASFPLRAWVPPPHRPFQPRLRVSAPAPDFRQEVLATTPIAGRGPRGVESASAPCPTFMATLSTCTASVKDLNKSGERQRYEGESWENKELGDEEKDPRTGGSVGKREIRRGQGRGRMNDQGGSEGRIRKQRWHRLGWEARMSAPDVCSRLGGVQSRSGNHWNGWYQGT